MKSRALIATLLLILIVKIINGQNNAMVNNENFQTNSFIPQQQPTYTTANSVQSLLNQNAIPVLLQNNVNQPQIMTQTNAPLPSPSTQRKQLPPDLQQEPLQVQQYLQLQKPIQLQPLQIQPPLQSQQSVPIQIKIQPPVQLQSLPLPIRTDVQTQDTLHLQPLMQVQQQLQQAPQTIQPLQPQHYLQVPQVLNLLEPLQIQPLHLQQSLQTHHPLQATHPQGFQQNVPQTTLSFAENNNLVETPVTQQITSNNNNQPNSQIQVKWKSSNPQVVFSIEKPQNKQNLNVIPQQNSITRPIDVVPNAQKSNDKLQDISCLRYYIAPQQPSALTTSSASAPVLSNSNPISVPSYKINPVEENYIPGTAPYGYIKPTPDVKLSLPEETKSVYPINTPSSILAIPPIQYKNDQIYYLNQQAIDLKQNANINQNSDIHYPQPHPVERQPAFVPMQSSILPSIPSLIRQTPSVPPQYTLSSHFPINTIIAPINRNQGPKSPNLKSLLPLIFNLLKEKIASCGCKNDCPCECKNNRCDNELELVRENSSQKQCGTLSNDGLPELNTTSEEAEGIEFLRERKNCEGVENEQSEVSSETLEDEEDSDEEELDGVDEEEDD